jgi:flagellar hook-length control protein FliK
VVPSESGQDNALRPQHQFTAPPVDSAGASKPAAEPLPNFGFTPLQGSAAVTSSAGARAAAALPAGIAIAELAVEIAGRAQAGHTRFEIRLDPPELGRVDVRLDVDRDGNASTRMIVDRSETLDLLRREAQQLERALAQAGLKMSDNALEFALRDHAFRGDDGADAPFARVALADSEPAAAENVLQHYARMFGLGRGVDISV